MNPKAKSLLVKAVFVAVLAVLTITLSGCASTKRVGENNEALVIAACPEMGEIAVLTPADSWRLHVADAKLYNTCRCAALRNTKLACPETPKPVN